MMPEKGKQDRIVNYSSTMVPREDDGFTIRDDLKECPFCGFGVILIEQAGVNKTPIATIGCNTAFCCGNVRRQKSFATKEAAITAWNARSKISRTDLRNSLAEKQYRIIPIAKCRMTRRDKWLKRPCVMAYWKYKDDVKQLKIDVPESNCHVIFILPMPESWPETKKLKMDGRPHRQRPDVDNLHKGLLDSIYKQDCYVWDNRITKRWGREGKIIVRTGIDDK